MSYEQVDSDVWRMNLSDEYAMPLMFLPEPEYDEAIVGIAQEGFVIYDAQKVVDVAAKLRDLNKEAAHAYADMNFFSVYGNASPMYFWPVKKPEALQP